MIACEKVANVMRVTIADIVLGASDEQIAQWLQGAFDEREAIRSYKRPAGFLAARTRAGPRDLPFGGPPPEWGPQTERRGEGASAAEMSLIDWYLEKHMDECADCGPWA